MKALGMLEIASIAIGTEAADAMMKAAEVELVTAQTVCAGKYIVLVTGEVAAVRASVKAGGVVAASSKIDEMIIPAVHEQVPGAIMACGEIGEVSAVGVCEFYSLCAAVIAADAAAKAAAVTLIDLRLGMGLGGKAFFVLTGEVAAVEAAVKAASALEEVQGLMSEKVVIPSPHPEIVKTLV